MTRRDDPTSPPKENWVHAALERHEKALTLYALRLLGELEAARDVVQETFLRLCKEHERDVEPDLAAWLFTVCRNLAFDVRRKERRMSTLSDEKAGGLASEARTPGESAERSDDLAHVLRSLAGLPAKQQEALRLKFQHGLSYKEIGRVMDESLGNVGWLIHVALKGLREEVAAEDVARDVKGAEA